MTSSDPSTSGQGSFEVITETETDALQLEMLEAQTSSSTSCHPSQEVDKLCGYIQKLGQRGLVKQYKLRWFVYGSNNCKLYYYRTPQDVLPLGEIEVSNATFSFEVGTNEKPGMFVIRNRERTYHLDAGNRQTMLYWLQELQKRRRQYSSMITSEQTKERSLTQRILKTQTPLSGLISLITDSNQSSTRIEAENEQELLPSMFAPVDPSDAMIGEKFAQNHKVFLSNLSWTNWKTELRNTFSQLRVTKSGGVSSNTEIAPCSPPPSLGSAPDRCSPPPSPDLTADDCHRSGADNSLPEPSKGRNPSAGHKDSRFLAFKRKFSSSKYRSQDDFTVPQNLNEISCQKCKQLYINLVSMRDDLCAADDELEAHREVVRLMQKQLELVRKQKATETDFHSSSSEEQRIDLLKMKDKLIVDLEHILTSTREERESFVHQLKSLDLERNSLKEQIAMYQESLSAKDEVVMSLTHQLSEAEKGAGPLRTSAYRELPVDDTLTTLLANSDRIEEIERLKDVVQAFELQNKFLNQEILELNQLRKDDQLREDTLTVKCAENEALYYQVKSKFLFLLNELNSPKRGGDEHMTPEFVTQLLQDAMESEVHSKVDGLEDSRSRMEYDRYGFAKHITWEDEDSDLVAKAKRMQKRCEEINKLMQESDHEVSLRVKWHNYLVSLTSRDIQPCPELKSLIRMGVPYEFKERIWKECVHFRVGNLRKQLGEHYYRELISSKTRMGKFNPAAKQIELDLLRTLPNNHHYENLNGEGITKLRRILQAYSVHNPLIGYCQGLNRLAGIALLFLNEEDAFWCLVAIVDHIMPQDYYSKTLMASQADQRVLKDLVSEKLPALCVHLESYDVDLSLFTFNWFLTVFVDNIPPDTFLRIWDVFLYEGTKVLFRFAIAFFKHCEEDLLSLKDHISIHKYLRFLGEMMADNKKLCQIAFHDLNPFPMRHINNKREHHMAQVKAELEELDAIREDFKTSQIAADRKEYVSDEDYD